jgi:hypothetical protein
MMLERLEDGDAVGHGVWRRVFEDLVAWQPDSIYYDDRVVEWDYSVCKYPFVPGFHVTHLDHESQSDTILSSHKTLHEAMAICKVLLANGGVRYE